MIDLTVNDRTLSFDGYPEMPLLWYLRDEAGLTGSKFGCGIALCGACTVHLDGVAVRSCVTPVGAARGKRVTTIESIGATAIGQAVQRAWVKLDVVQCSYCQYGQIMSAAALLAQHAKPSDADNAGRMAGRSPPAAPGRQRGRLGR
ncbi:(2Fe-2S)-binding protein [Pseudomonas aeruginosa]|uniref:(2Fe-2S)-binding protein n=1 Tax=Pseudomonas aeruginosa TaxID=287 RepID=UPI0015F02852|nr:(2Fe-2S)-binding protein [Pseudomonas aeruginosa]MBA4991527.1 (2Fe-2S)-binding protein [Pseudomonas aeruginosa]HBP0508840.1 (2Fe-2S)-binding protein [Pseudomonas aeruginosa]HEO1755651.1 (2Fe-2S)-binding protein [Pseudomonas aeruginosa]